MERWAPAIAFAVVFIPAMVILWIQHKLYGEQIEDQRDLSQEMDARERRRIEKEKKRRII